MSTCPRTVGRELKRLPPVSLLVFLRRHPSWIPALYRLPGHAGWRTTSAMHRSRSANRLAEGCSVLHFRLLEGGKPAFASHEEPSDRR